MPGWECYIDNVRDYEKLPENAKSYIKKIEDCLNIPSEYILY